MAVIQDIIAALWQHDFAALADPHIVSVVYFVMFATLFLENGLLPASFLPGDSLLILAGALIAQTCCGGQNRNRRQKIHNPLGNQCACQYQQAVAWQHDFAALADPHIVSVVYFVMFATL
ncbi:hypothetical protein ACUOCP_33335, partial [Escherichia sp. R-CC3]